MRQAGTGAIDQGLQMSEDQLYLPCRTLRRLAGVGLDARDGGREQQVADSCGAGDRSAVPEPGDRDAALSGHGDPPLVVDGGRRLLPPSLRGLWLFIPRS